MHYSDIQIIGFDSFRILYLHYEFKIMAACERSKPHIFHRVSAVPKFLDRRSGRVPACLLDRRSNLAILEILAPPGPVTGPCYGTAGPVSGPKNFLFSKNSDFLHFDTENNLWGIG